VLDLLIRGGTVFDGSPSPPRRADVGVHDGRIVALDAECATPARETVDARGLWVAPGFVDLHTHYDLEVEVAPGLGESVRHGVTTVVMGHCSLSLTIGDPATLADIFLRVETLPAVLVRKWLQRSVSWQTPRDYVRHLGDLALGPNVAALLGHSALRAEVMGLERSLSVRATGDDLRAMRRLAAEALDAGCIGISVDMLPWHMMSGRYRGRPIPSHHADFREYRMLADLCRERDAVFQVSPNPQDLASFWHVLRLALGGGRPALRVTVLAALDPLHTPRLWRVLPPLLTAANRALGGNVRSQTLPEPFTVYSDGPITPLFEEFPCGARLNDAGSRAERAALWREPRFRARFVREWRGGWRKTFHRDLDAMTIVRCPDRSLESRTFADVARARGREAVETFVDLLAVHDTDLRWVATGANGRLGPRLQLLGHRYVLPGFSDAGAHVRSLGFYDGALSLLRQAAATGFMTPERAIHRVTGEPAEWLRLDAGRIAPGARADVVLLRPQELATPLAEQVEIADPVLDGALRMVKRGSEAIVHSVYVRGVRAWADGGATDALGRERLGAVLTQAPPDRGGSGGHGRRRDRIGDGIEDHPFTDYWPIFVLKHQRPANVALHMLGVVLFYGLAAAAWVDGSAWWLLGLPSSQLAGLAGHRLFERSHIDRRDAVFSLRASFCLNRMFVRVLLGRYPRDVRQAREALRAHRQGRPDAAGAPAAAN
jgi:N-acyl-D-aspartate/D-glutamate deacylase